MSTLPLRSHGTAIALFAATLLTPWSLTAASIAKPNIVVIVADDLGYGELGCYGGKDVPTPHLDSLARHGVRFTNGYVTASVCGPSRAGLMTGRYQNRFGFEENPLSAMNADPRIGLPPEQATIGSMLQDAGYITAAIGKWHLGGTAKYHPLRRGFDEFFGFLHEGHFYLPSPWTGTTSLFRRPVLPGGGQGRSPEGPVMYHTVNTAYEDPYDADNPVLRGGTTVDEKQHLTDAFTREAVDFIARQKSRPFFLYLAYNAVHSPLQGVDAYMRKFAHIPDIHRRIFVSMLAHLDDSVGRVLQRLRDEGLEENTLIIFLSDNGGPTRELTSSNAPLRGGKGAMTEGGIRVPFLAQWKDRLPAARTYDRPVIALDLAATAAALGGVTEAEILSHLDGVNLLPFLTGERTGSPHDTLYWRRGKAAALRHGEWKLVRPAGSRDFELYNLATDLGEETDLAKKQPDRLTELVALWDRWNNGNIAPLFDAPRRNKNGQWLYPPEGRWTK